MAEEQKYPDTVLPRGSRIVAKKALNHYCMLKKIVDMRDKIGHDAYDDIERNSQLGVILKLAGLGFTWAGKHVQYLLANMLYISKKSEIWVLVAPGRPVRFSLHEFEHITELNCGMRNARDADFAQGELWREMGLSHGNGPSWPDLEAVLRRCMDWSLAKRKMVGLLVVLHVGIFGLHPNSRLSAYHAKLVMDPERFERHPWGRVAFEILISSIPRTAHQLTASYTLHGLVHVLLVWAFEYIPALGIAAGERRQGAIPLLRWAGRPSRGLETEAILEHYRASSDNKVNITDLTDFLNLSPARS